VVDDGIDGSSASGDHGGFASLAMVVLAEMGCHALSD